MYRRICVGMTENLQAALIRTPSRSAIVLTFAAAAIVTNAVLLSQLTSISAGESVRTAAILAVHFSLWLLVSEAMANRSASTGLEPGFEIAYRRM